MPLPVTPGRSRCGRTRVRLLTRCILVGGRANGKAFADVKICKWGEKKNKNPLALRRVVFISRGERRRLGGPAIGAASCGRHGRNSLRSFSVICAFGEKMQSRKSVDVWRAGADTSLVAVRERTMNKFSCVPRRLPSITKHKVSVLRPVCMEHQITLQQMS